MIQDQQVKRPVEHIGQEYAAVCSQLGDVLHSVHEHELTKAELHAKLSLLKREFKEAEELAKAIAQKEQEAKILPDNFVDEAHPFVSDIAP